MAFAVQKRQLYGGDIELIFSPNSRNRYLVNMADGTTVYPPGVTTILSKVLAKEALMMWPLNMATNWLKDNCLNQVLTELHLEEARRAHVKKSDKGKDVGTEVHEAIEQILNITARTGQYEKTDIVEVQSPEAEKALKAFRNWLLDTAPRVLAAEEIVYSLQHHYSGTFDALLEIDGKVVLADVKTTNASKDAPLGIYPEYFLQLGAYSLAYTENERCTNGDDMWGEIANPIDDIMVINASKTGKLSTLRASELGLSVCNCEDAWMDVLRTYKFLEPLKRQIKEMA